MSINGVAQPKPLLPGTTLHPTNFQEDGDGSTPYGNRNAPAVAGDQYLPDQQTGCQYRGTDAPGAQNIPSGTTIGINLEFQGKLMETGDGRTLATSTWSVVGTVTPP
jgi:hypothetical protein